MDDVHAHGDTQFQRDITNLATEVESRPPLEVPQVLHPRSRRRIYWIAGLLTPLVLGGIVVAILLQWQPAVGVPTAPAGLIAAFDHNPCAQRMARIITAVSAYSAQHGAPPDALAQLIPGYLSEPVVDPGSGLPYGYQRDRDSVVLVCPDAERHTPLIKAPPPEAR